MDDATAATGKSLGLGCSGSRLGLDVFLTLGLGSAPEDSLSLSSVTFYRLRVRAEKGRSGLKGSGGGAVSGKTAFRAAHARGGNN